MKLLVRGCSFIFGAILAAVVGTLINDVFAFFWLPILMGLAVSLVVYFQPWFRASRLAVPFCASLTSGTALTYCVSTPAAPTDLAPLPPKIVMASQILVFIGVLLWFLVIGLRQRKTGAMTIWLFIPVVAGCVLGYVSGGIGGSDHMMRWFMETLHFSKDQAEVFVHYLRKSIHFTAYGTLGLTLFRGAIAGGAAKRTAISFALLVVLCISSFDETRQTTAPNRTGTPLDVALDMAGTSVFVLLSAALVRSPRKSPKK